MNRETIKELITTYLHMAGHENTAVAAYGQQWANYWLTESRIRYGYCFSAAEIEEMKRARK